MSKRNRNLIQQITAWDNLVDAYRKTSNGKRKVANFIKHGEDEGLQKFLASWSGHAMWADANNLFTWLEKRHGIALH